MANRYINKFYDPSDTTQVNLYTSPSNGRAIIQNIQVVNESGGKTVKIFITDSSASTTYQVAYASISGPTTCNMAKGPLILEEGDSLLLQTTDTAGITAAISILEFDRT
jgi:hypothetical protein